MSIPIKEKCCEYVDRCISDKVSLKKSYIIIGFWRSGTTWMQNIVSEITGSKVIFEPFYYGIDSFFDLISRDPVVVSEEEEYLSSFMPYCEDFSNCRELSMYTEKAIRGALRGAWLRRGRTVKRSCAARTVTKFVRGHLITPALESLGPTVIHVRRDPRAVISSLLRGNWGGWLRDVSIRKLLLDPEDGRAEFFSKWKDPIRKADASENFVVHLATYWALTERFVEAQDFQENGGVSIMYEKIGLNGKKYLSNKFDGVVEFENIKNIESIGFNSITTQETRKDIGIKERRCSWKKELDKIQKRKIEEVVNNIMPKNKLLIGE